MIVLRKGMIIIMLRKGLPPERPKSQWTHADSFGKGIYIQAFTHYNYDIGMHTHDFMEVNIVLAGTGQHYVKRSERLTPCDNKVHIEQIQYAARPGSVFVIPAGIQHGYTNGGGLNVWHLLVHREFIPQYAPDLPKLFGYTMLFEVEPFLRSRSTEGLFLSLSGSEFNNILMNIHCMELYLPTGDPDVEILKQHAAAYILANLCFYMAHNQQNIPERKNEALRSIASCLEYIHCHFSEKISINFLANMANMSRSTLTRKFWDICGCPPATYISQYRLRKADEMKQDKNYSLTEIAHACGFYDLSHMERTKRQQMNE